VAGHSSIKQSRFGRRVLEGVELVGDDTVGDDLVENPVGCVENPVDCVGIPADCADELNAIRYYDLYLY
jgi:hypothetical protein